MSKLPVFKFFSKTKFSVSNENKYYVGVKPQPTLNCVGRIWKRSIKNSPCHPELVSGSGHHQKCSAICTQKSNVGQVCPTDINILLNTDERSIIVSCLRHLKAQPTLIPVSSRWQSIVMKSLRPYSPRKVAFTLAEVLITLGIIGVVAAMTLPVIVTKVQENILKTQFKKAYNLLTTAVNLTRNQEGYDVACYYWGKNPYGSAHCSSYNSYGECTSWTMPDGSALVANYNGPMSDCKDFYIKLKKNLKIVKRCEDHAYQNGCSPLYTSGTDTTIDNGDNPNPNKNYSVNSLRNTQAMEVLDNGMILMPYGNNFSMPLWYVDINGSARPNKFGYDIFKFEIVGDGKGSAWVGIRGLGSERSIEEGGKTTDEMIKDIAIGR